MGKRPQIRRGRDRNSRLVPVMRPRVGLRVWWQVTSYHEGVPYLYWKNGLIEVKRGQMCVIRDAYGHDHVVGVGMFFESEPT